jgi:hypothetical protein
MGAVPCTGKLKFRTAYILVSVALVVNTLGPQSGGLLDVLSQILILCMIGALVDSRDLPVECFTDVDGNLICKPRTNFLITNSSQSAVGHLSTPAQAVEKYLKQNFPHDQVETVSPRSNPPPAGYIFCLLYAISFIMLSIP